MSKRKKRDPRYDFLKLIPREARKILDIGCGDGDLSGRLKAGAQREIVGIDKDENACRKARRTLDKVIVSDTQKLGISYPDGYFDCLIYADVLDCLVDPLSALKEHRRYLKDGGHVVASMANVRYYKVLIRLALGGTWDYVEPGGILWKQHIRFFTLLNMKELFEEAGYEITDIRRYAFSSRGFRLLNLLCFNMLKEFLTYQYYIKATKIKDTELGTFARKRKVHVF